MITAYLQGGMGNQMFQYAMAYALAARLRQDFCLNRTSFQHDGMREYQLNLWGIREHDDAVLAYGTVIEERGMPYNPDLFLRTPEYFTVKGYWQTEKYFFEYRDELLEIFKPQRQLNEREQELLQSIKAAGERSVFLTVRRTDYLNNAFHGGMLPLNYYLDALMLIKRLSGQEPHVFVFSDDVDWCRDYFVLPYQTTIAGNFDRTVKGHIGREDIELYLMKNCRHCVMANSSYSWWGAWLGEGVAAKKIIVAPKQWFGPASNEDPRDIIPNRWITI